MRELDLVPGRYHRRRTARDWMVAVLVVSVLATTGIVGARAFLKHRSSEYGRELESFEADHARARMEEQELERLLDEQRALAQRLAVLTGLRGGVAAKQMFRIVDDSLAADVWFRRWSFLRAGEIVEEEEQAVETGYFIVLPRENADDPQKTWQFRTHMEFKAEADSHSALAGFVRRLTRKPEIESARILSTNAQPGVGSNRVEFKLAVVVRSSQ